MNVRSGDPLLGHTLGDRYQIVRRIARGGMATVFEAVDLRLSRTVAVKVMHPGLESSDEVAARFDTEAKAAALLSHPHVVGVFDQGTDDGRPYIVMEFVRGITLRQLITLEAPFPAARALQLYEPVVAALAHAHDAGLIHRDVKPENVLISERGQIKVADFGLARTVTAATVAEGGVVIGTVSYIAPEIVSRGHASTRSDVYSLGILLYELLTGRKPHRGASPIEVAYAHVHTNVPAPSASTEAADAIPDFLDDLVRTSTSRSLSARQADAGVLLRQVRAARDAVAHGVADRPALRALMAATSSAEADAVAGGRSRLVTSSAGAPALGVPATASRASGSVAAALRLPALPAAGPSGAATNDDRTGSRSHPEPISPYSPPTRVVPVPARSQWEQAPVYRRRRLTVGVASLALVACLGAGGWWVAAGRLPATPVTAGLAQPDAQAAVTGAGFNVQFVREYSDTVPAGVATRSDPDQGARLQPGTTVIVYLSQGPHLFDVPALAGKTRDEALRALTDAGLAAGAITEAYDEQVPVGQVLRQGVAGGAGLRRGSGVDFVLSRGPEPAQLPSTIGRPVAEVKSELAAAGFAVRTAEQYSPTVAKGQVIAQRPAAGQVRKSDTVTLTVSKGPGSVLVPDVRRLDIASAAAKLRAAGFAVAVVSAPDAASVPGTVVSTLPTAGRRLTQGQTVTLTVG